MLSQGVLEIAPIGVLTRQAAVREQHEGGRRGRDLRGVAQLELAPAFDRGMVAGGDPLEQPIQLAGRHLEPEPFESAVERGQDLREAPTGERRDVDARRVAQQLGEARPVVLEPETPVARGILRGIVLLGLCEQVPLVHHDQRGATLVPDRAGDREVAARDALLRVDHERRHVGARDLALGHHHRELLRGLGDLAAPANAGGVDQQQATAPLAQERRVERVARGAGHRGDQRALHAEQPVHQRRLADVRAADDRERGQVARYAGGRARQKRDQGLEQLVHTERVLGRNEHLRTGAQRVELREGVLGGVRVAFVHRHHGRAPVATKPRPDLFVGGRRPLLPVDDQHQRVALLDREQHLLVDAERIVAGRDQTPGVDELDRGVVGDVTEAGDAVSSDSRPVVNDGASRADQAIEQGRLADVRPADDRHHRRQGRRRGALRLARLARQRSGLQIDFVGHVGRPGA